MVRMNIYAEELTEDVEIVEKTADTGAKFIGVRLYLKSPSELHHTDKDDDRSAITLWVKSSKEGFKPGDAEFLYKLLMVAGGKLSEKAYDLTHRRAKDELSWKLYDLKHPETALCGTCGAVGPHPKHPEKEKDPARSNSWYSDDQGGSQMHP